MPNITDRRRLLISGASLLGLCFTVNTGFARDSERGSNELTDFLDARQYSQAEIVALNHKELTYLYNYRIDGFLDAMASNIVKMMLSDRLSTQHLMHDMALTHDKNIRAARLADEMAFAAGKVQALTRLVAHLKADPSAEPTVSLAGGTRLLRRARVYNRSVKSWSQYPREGTYPVPKPFLIPINF